MYYSNMKYFAAIILFLATAGTSLGAEEQDCHLNCLETYMVMHVSLQPSAVDDWVKYTRECATKHRVTPKICYGLLKRDYPEDENEACFFSCFAEKINVVLSNATNLDAIKTSMSDRQFEIANKCLGEFSPPTEDEKERCWNVYKTHQCYMTTLDQNVQ